MKKQYLIGIMAFIGLGVFLAFSGVKQREYYETKPDQLFLDLIESTRYFTVEEVAQKIISQDPSIQLVDVRDSVSYHKFTLSGAINMPLNELLKPYYKVYLVQDVYIKIFFSNGSCNADVAWMICNRMGYKNTFVMLGGLNTWVEHILEPTDHSVVWDKVDDQMYQYRRGASIYFGGETIDMDNAGDKVKPKKPLIKRKKKEVEGGCS